MALLKDEETTDQRKYNHISRKEYQGRYVYFLAKYKLNGERFSIKADTAKDAAKALDKWLLSKGAPQVNNMFKPVNA